MAEDRFLSRWARRKAGLESDKTKEIDADNQQLVEPVLAKTSTATEAAPEKPVANMDDVEQIDSKAPDFSAFMQSNVDPAVQQAALKKMFTDPHFNIMDGLDIYIDDYSKPDPIPLEMLKRMNQSSMLGLFDKVEEVLKQKSGLISAPNQTAAPVENEQENEPAADAIAAQVTDPEPLEPLEPLESDLGADQKLPLDPSEQANIESQVSTKKNS
ncbi:MAG: DUF3306 domain-containing protein [Polynucleobacter sp.]|jgi:hypothetical protein|nr:DUF3306 domain-containing protein [Polynucleobacter sp.]